MQRRTDCGAFLRLGHGSPRVFDPLFCVLDFATYHGPNTLA
jgi:hypothetical protein